MDSLYNWAAVLLLVTGVGFCGWWIAGRMTFTWNTNDPGEGQHGGPFRFCRSMGQLLVARGPRLVAQKVGRDRVLIRRAGFALSWADSDLLGVQAVAALVAATGAGYWFSDSLPTSLLIGAVLGWYWPSRWIGKKRQERQRTIECDFPSAIDMIMLGLEGGLDFVGGIREMVQALDDSPLRSELNQVLQSVQMGKSRKEALRDFAEGIDSTEIRTVITTLVQALDLGAGIVDTLRVQAEQLRLSRLLRAETEANKVATKMVMPMLLFIMPCVFLIIFGPVAMRIIQAFSGF